MKIEKVPLHSRVRKVLFAKKAFRLFFKLGVSFLAFFIVLISLLLGRLSMGPLKLDFIVPQVEEALKIPQMQISTSVEHVQLVWQEWAKPFEIELVNVRIQKGEDPHWLKIDHVGVTLRLMQLLTGHISLKNLIFYQPHILLEKDERGEFIIEFGGEQSEHQLSFKDISSLLALGASHPSLGKLNEVKKISIIDANILLKDAKENREWDLPHITFTLKRKTNGFQTELNIRPQNTNNFLTLGMIYHLDSSRSNIYAEFHNISFKDIIKKERVTLCSPRPEEMTPDDILNYLYQWDVPLNGKIHMVFMPETLQLIEGAGNINMGKGEVDLSLSNLLAFPIQSGSLSFLLSPQEIELKNFSLLSDEMLAHLSGKLTSPNSPLLLHKLLDTHQTLELQGRMEDFLLSHLSALWPEEVAIHARAWLTENLHKGTLTKASFSLKGQKEEKGFVVDDVKGTLEAEGVELTYLKGLPPAQNVKAQANFDQKKFDIKLLSGNVEKIELQSGDLVLSNLDTNNEALSLDITATGALANILEVINHKPLQYATYGGIDPKKAKGTGKVNFHIEFPLLADLRFKDVKIALKGSFNKVAIERKITENLIAQFTQGELNVDLTQDQMIIKGEGILNQLPSQLVYTQYFDPQELKIAINTRASFEDFKRFGFDYQEYGKGLTETKLIYTVTKDKKSSLAVDLDTTAAHLFFPPLRWEKQPGGKGRLSFLLHFEDGLLAKMDDLTMESPTYFLKGHVLFGPQKKWETIHLSQFRGPQTDAQLTLHTPQANIYEISCKGTNVNLEDFLEYVNTAENKKDHPPTDIRLSAEVDQLRLGEGRLFQNVNVTANLFLQDNDTTWKAVKLRAKAGKNVAYGQKSEVANVAGGILFDITPGPNNTQTLEVRANDAGKFLKTLSIYDDVKEGYIVIKAKRKEKGPYVGIFKLKQFNVNKVPVLARFAALLSPMGITNLFSTKETLSMDRFDCNFQFSEDQIVVQKGVGKSIALGFTVDGKLDRKKRMYALKGNLIPARFLNSILNNIPLIGSLLSGGEGEGLFGIAYSVSGSFDDPAISLNPLSVLAPGFIRKLFQSLGDED